MNLLGVDVGTTWCKAAVVSEDGRELSNHRTVTPWREVPGGAEVEPRMLLDAALGAADGALAHGPPGPLAGLGVTSMAETGVLIDRRGEPVAPAIAWHDERGAAEIEAIASALGGSDRFALVTGCGAGPLCSLAKYAWLRSNRPESRHGVRWLSVAEWVVRGLGGEEIGDLSLASRTGMLDVDCAASWEDALAEVRGPGDLLPDLAASGTPAGRASRRLDRARGAVLCTAGHDHLGAAIGADAYRDDEVFDSCGTAEALVRAVPPAATRELRTRAVRAWIGVGWHAVPGRHALLAGFHSGLALRRLGALLGADDAEARHALEAEAAHETPAPDGAAALAATSAAGLPTGESPAAIWRSALDALAATARARIDALDALAGPHRRVVAAGGGVRSEAAFQARREAFAPSRLDRPDVAEAGARGAALLAGVAAGVFEDLAAAPPPVVEALR